MGLIQHDNTKIYVINSTESDASSATISQYPVEEGAPISDNVMYMGGPVTVAGSLLGNNAEQDYKKLVEWQKNNYQLTYRGRIYIKTVAIQDMSRSYNNVGNGFGVSVTLMPIRIAKATWEKIPQPPAKKQPTPAASPAVYVTVQPGNTYWGWWVQYGTPIQTLRDWNKWPDRFIPIGARARVK